MPKLSIFLRRIFPIRLLPIIILPIMALVAIASVAFFPASTVNAAQQPSAQAPAQQPAAPDQKSDDSQQPTETLKVNVNVVQLFFNVKDKHGALIPNLTKSDFEIYEDGKPQTIKYFTAESNLPLTLGIMIDSSGSQRNVIDMEKEVGGAFLRQILTDKDEAFVISFDISRRPAAGFHPRRAPPAGRAQQSQSERRLQQWRNSRHGRRPCPAA